jgi:hypothetical protein
MATARAFANGSGTCKRIYHVTHIILGRRLHKNFGSNPMLNINQPRRQYASQVPGTKLFSFLQLAHDNVAQLGICAGA